MFSFFSFIAEKTLIKNNNCREHTPLSGRPPFMYGYDALARSFTAHRLLFNDIYFEMHLFKSRHGWQQQQY